MRFGGLKFFLSPFLNRVAALVTHPAGGVKELEWMA